MTCSIRSGSVCLDVINQTWSPMFDMINIFEVFLPQLLRYPNPADPLNGEAAALLMRDPKSYDARVKGRASTTAEWVSLGRLLTTGKSMSKNTPVKMLATMLEQRAMTMMTCLLWPASTTKTKSRYRPRCRIASSIDTLRRRPGSIGFRTGSCPAREKWTAATSRNRCCRSVRRSGTVGLHSQTGHAAGEWSRCRCWWAGDRHRMLA